MMKKLIFIAVVIIMFTGCSKTISYKYDAAVSQSGDWSVDNGRISVRDGEDFIKYNIKYEGDSLIKQGESWSCKVMVCKNNTENSISTAEEVFSHNDIYGKELAKGGIKVVDTDNDVIDINNDYDFSTVYLYIEYVKENEVSEDVIELSLK